MRLWLAAVILLGFTGLASAVDMSAAQNLRILNTTHYRIHTDLDRSLAEDLGRRMDAMYEEYSRRLAVFDTNHSGDRFDVYLFYKHNDYLKFTGFRLSNTGGMTIPEINIVTAFLETQGRDQLREVLQHEAFHQFAASVIHRDLPPWLNEGLAVMFEEGIWTGRNFLLGQIPPRRIRQLQDDIASNKLIDFPTMMKMSLKDWNTAMNQDHLRGATQYTQAWAMCEFLVYAAEQQGPQRGQPKYRARFLDLLQRIHGGTDPMEAFKLAFSPNIDGFQKHVRAMDWQIASADDRGDVDRAAEHSRRHAGKVFAGWETVRRYRIVPRGTRPRRIPDAVHRQQREVGNRPRSAGLFQQFAGPAVRERTSSISTCGAARRCLDLVCDPVEAQIHLRTRFYDAPGNDKIEHETLVEGGGELEA